MTGETYSSIMTRDNLGISTEDLHIDMKSDLDTGRCSAVASTLAPLRPRGHVGMALTYIVAVLTVWGAAFSLFGKVALPGTRDEEGEVQDLEIAIKGGTIFALIVLVVVAYLVGQVVSLVKLPPLLGMLVVGILLKNVPYIDVAKMIDPEWASALRNLALAVILLRAGLGLDPGALKKLSMMVFRLAFSPCLVETVVIAAASYFLLAMPWEWGFMLGFVLAAVTPAVVVPCMLSLQEQGFGVAKGVPTLVIAAASVDDVLAISCFTILLGITFTGSDNLAMTILRGPLEALLGLVWGLVGGVLAIFLPPQPSPSTVLRVLILGGGGILALFGSAVAQVPGAGALAVLVAAFVAGIGWRRQGWGDDNPVNDVLEALWLVFEPLLFALIGAEIKVDALEGDTVGWGLLVVVVGLAIRTVVAFLATLGGDLNVKERVFVALAWLPKATVQAAIGSTALDYARKALDATKVKMVATGVNIVNGTMETAGNVTDEHMKLLEQMKLDEHNVELGETVLTIAVLVILISAPIGAVAIMLTGPKLLSKEEKDKNTD